VAYHVATGLRLQGGSTAAALRRALDALVARHEALRTTIVAAADGDSADLQAVQCIGPVDTPFSLAEHDLRALEDAARSTAVDELVASEARAPFDLATAR
jgi:hypothetical protein